MNEFPFGVVELWTRRWHTDRWEGPSGIPHAWATAVAAVERDLGCWVRKKPLPDFTDYEWDVILSEFGFAHFQLRAGDESGWNGYLSTTNGLEVDRSVAGATLHLADEVQGDLTGHHWIDWPSAGWGILTATVIDDTAMWVRSRDRQPIARIGHLCTDCTQPW